MKYKWGGRFPLESLWRFFNLFGVISLCFVIFPVHPSRFRWFWHESHNAPLNLREMYFWYDLGITQLYTILSFHIDSQLLLAQSPGLRFWTNYCSNILDAFMCNHCSERKCHAFSHDVGRTWMSPTLISYNVTLTCCGLISGKWLCDDKCKGGQTLDLGQM